MVAAAGEPPAAVPGGGDAHSVSASAAHIVDTRPSIQDLSSKGSEVSVAEKGMAQREWNTKKLGQRMAVDATCAATAGVLVAPLITVIDRAIIENASGRSPMMSSLKSSLSTLLLRPHRFLASRPFRLIFMLYSGTYVTANWLDTFTSTTRNRIASSTTAGPAKFAATSAANLGLCLYKDSQFTRLFGLASARPVPPATYALFATRDALTVFASFNLPPILATSLPLPATAEQYISRVSAAQFLAPAAIQLISTPLHLLGLDLYNRPGATPFFDRLAKVRADWLKSSLARMCRIVPAFGFGGVVNNGTRSQLMKNLE